MSYTSRKCPAPKKDGSPCKAWAVRTSDPPRCAPHGGGKARVGAPGGNDNATTHGVYSLSATPPTNLDTRIKDLDARVCELSEFIDGLDKTTALGDRLALFDLHGRLTSRLGRLMKDRQAVTEPDAHGMEAELREALGIASGILGLDLLKKSTFPIEGNQARQ